MSEPKSSNQRLSNCKSNKSLLSHCSGSMPMYWTQTADLSYLPSPTVTKHEDHLAAFLNHFQRQFNKYGHQVSRTTLAEMLAEVVERGTSGPKDLGSNPSE